MGTLSKEALQLACDNVLVRNAQALKHAIETIEEKGFIPQGQSSLIEELRQNLQVMEEEIKRRGLEVPEGEEQSGFLEGLEYTSEFGRRGSSREADSRTSRISARVSK